MADPAPAEFSAQTFGTEETERVAAKAFIRIAEAWELTNEEAAALADTVPRTWSRTKAAGSMGRIGQDQMMRISALTGLYKGLHLFYSEPLADRWVKLPNSGPLFKGATPVEHMRRGGLPAILATRNYVDAVRGGV